MDCTEYEHQECTWSSRCSSGPATLAIPYLLATIGITKAAIGMSEFYVVLVRCCTRTTFQCFAQAAQHVLYNDSKILGSGSDGQRAVDPFTNMKCLGADYSRFIHY